MIIFNATGTPAKPVAWCARRAMWSMGSMLLIAVPIWFGVDRLVAGAIGVAFIMLTMPLRLRGDPHMVKVSTGGGGAPSISGRFAEGVVKPKDGAIYRSASLDAAGLAVEVDAGGTVRVLTLSSDSFPNGTLTSVDAILREAVAADATAIAARRGQPNVKLWEPGDNIIINFTVQPGYLRLTWLSFAIALAGLFLVIQALAWALGMMVAPGGNT